MNTPLTRLLAAAGAIPFLIGAFAPVLGIELMTRRGDVEAAVLAYGLAIASFMAGVHWGTALNASRSLPVNLYISSNVIAVAAWFVYLFASATAAALMLAGLFAVLLGIDWKLRQAGAIDNDYWQTRLWVTVVVIACLLLMAG